MFIVMLPIGFGALCREERGPTAAVEAPAKIRTAKECQKILV